MNDRHRQNELRLTSFSHGGGGGCTIAPGVLACSAQSGDEVLSIFRGDGFEHAAVVGELIEGPVQVRLA